MSDPVVAIVMGSDSDKPLMEESGKVLEEFGVPYEYKIASAHRSPEFTAEYAKSLQKRGIQVVIAAAGYSAHLAGVVAAYTTLPVLAVPMDISPLKGLDSLLSMGQMPAGVPVGTMTIGKSGAKNAAYFALQILGLKDETLADRLRTYRKELARSVELKNK